MRMGGSCSREVTERLEAELIPWRQYVDAVADVIEPA